MIDMIDDMIEVSLSIDDKNGNDDVTKQEFDDPGEDK